MSKNKIKTRFYNAYLQNSVLVAYRVDELVSRLLLRFFMI